MKHGVLCLFICMLVAVGVAPFAMASEDDTLRFANDASAGNDTPRRERMMLGLDLGGAAGMIHGAHESHSGDVPGFFRISFRPAYCVRPWLALGIDWDMILLVAANGGKNFDGPNLLQPSLSFYPFHGLSLRAAGGFDPYNFSPSLSADLGYEFAVSARGAIGLGVAFTELWRREDGHRLGAPWQLYSLMLLFTGYDVLRGFTSLDKP